MTEAPRPPLYPATDRVTSLVLESQLPERATDHPRPLLTRRYDESTRAHATASTRGTGLFRQPGRDPAAPRAPRRCPASNYWRRAMSTGRSRHRGRCRIHETEAVSSTRIAALETSAPGTEGSRADTVSARYAREHEGRWRPGPRQRRAYRQRCASRRRRRWLRPTALLFRVSRTRCLLDSG